MSRNGQGVVIKHPIPAKLSGTKFLQSSHFSISQEEAWTPWTRQSTFKQDYAPYNNKEKPSPAHIPPPAEILNADERYFKNNHRASETVAEFQPKKGSERATYDTNKLRSTNFKLDCDTRQTENVISTQKASFLAHGGGGQVFRPSLNTSASHIPQGDKEKAFVPVSDYRDKFRAHAEGRDELVKATTSSPTIKGDQRVHSYGTTHGSTFEGKWQEPLKMLPAQRTSSIPTGDGEKQHMGTTEFKSAYQSADASQLKPYDRLSHGNSQKTQIRLEDGHNTYNDYGTTMNTSYVPVEVAVERTQQGSKRNHSDIPPGDTDMWRQIERGCTTSYAYHMQKPPQGYINPIANGAERRTQSQVVFGDAELYKKYYQTTHNETFQPYENVLLDRKDGRQGKSVIPLDYYGNELTAPTQKADYQPYSSGKQQLNTAVLDNLKSSHIKAPLGSQRYFSTTQKDHFTPKDLAQGNAVDTGKLQKSSVPLGTLYDAS